MTDVSSLSVEAALIAEMEVHGVCDSSQPLPTCRQNWPDDPRSWCLGCLLASAARALQASQWQPEWRPVVGYERRYEVSNTGLIRTKAGRLLGQWASDQGYMLARVSGPRAVLRVHRAVAEAFIENPKALPSVNHINCQRANNNAYNLEWCTQAENLQHSANLGRMQRDYWKGKRSPNASLSDAVVAQIRSSYASGDGSLETLGKRFGISKRAIGRIVNRETYV